MFENTVKILKSKNFKVAFAESCTGGLLSKSITDVPGASDVFPGGVVSYSNEIKTGVLGVSPETIRKYTEVSHDCAKEMAGCAARLFSSDIAVSSTGYAGPGGGTDNDPVGTVYVGVYVCGKVYSYRLRFEGKDRACVRDEVCSFAAYMIESEVLKL